MYWAADVPVSDVFGVPGRALPARAPLDPAFRARVNVHRFRGPRQLCCWAGLTPLHRESDTTVHRGSITKQGSRLLRWGPQAAHVGLLRPARRTHPLPADHDDVSGLGRDRTRVGPCLTPGFPTWSQP